MFTKPDPPSSSLAENSLPHAVAILEQISDCFLALDTGWRITYLNEIAAQTLGRRREDLLGRRLWDEFPGSEAGAFGQAYHQAVDTQTPVLFKAFSPYAQRWFSAQAYPSSLGLSVSLHDITEARETQQRLEENEQRYRSLFEQNPDAVFSFDLDGRFTSANHACETLSGYLPQELIGTPFLRLIAPEDTAKVINLFAEVRRGNPCQEEFTLLHKTGRLVQINAAKIPMVVDGVVVGIYGIAKDITSRKQAETALRESEERLRMVAAASPVAMTITQWESGEIVFCNQHFRALFGIAGEAVGQLAADFFAVPSDQAQLRDLLTDDTRLHSWEFQLQRQDGTVFWASGASQRMVYGGASVIFSAYHDVTERRRLLDEARDEAEHDPLTGLWNHRAFHKRFTDEAERAMNDGRSLAVAVLDLDNFKFFNDAYGHGSGDDVLQQTAEALRVACRSGDVLARFGGDEFALLLPDVDQSVSAEEIATRLEASLNGLSHAPAGYDVPIPVSLSIGVALFPAESPTRSGVLQMADERLRSAKTGAAFDSETLSLRLMLRSRLQGFSMLEALVTAVDAKDRYTRRHSEDVMRYSLQIARALGLEEPTLHTIAVSALLHDVGKIGVPDRVLRKPGKLTDEEFEAVKLHPNIGAVIVGAVPGLEKTLDAVQHHHERWDGAGYPFGLRGEETPLVARLMAVADAYSAMTTDRPYRKGMGPPRAMAILQEGAGTQWDPACVRAFLQSSPESS